MLNRDEFFSRIRTSLFGGTLTQPQVDGCNAILDACKRHAVGDLRHKANVLAQVYHETGGYMMPIKETVYASHKNKNPSDATVIKRLDKAWAKGQLPWVKTAYWRHGWFGRGQIQLTWEDNYAKAGKRLGVDLVGKPGLALDPDISADIAVRGMSEGWFRKGHSLSKYFNSSTNDPINARRIVNGPDGTEDKVAEYHYKFLEALKAAETTKKPEKPTVPSTEEEPHWLGRLLWIIIGGAITLGAAIATYFNLGG